MHHMKDWLISCLGVFNFYLCVWHKWIQTYFFEQKRTIINITVKNWMKRIHSSNRVTWFENGCCEVLMPSEWMHLYYPNIMTCYEFRLTFCGVQRWRCVDSTSDKTELQPCESDGSERLPWKLFWEHGKPISELIFNMNMNERFMYFNISIV